MSGKYKCVICGYVYDPNTGDEENEIEPGTSFDDLPEAWICPVCGADKEDFEEMKLKNVTV
jgi:rubredoxin